MPAHTVHDQGGRHTNSQSRGYTREKLQNLILNKALSKLWRSNREGIMRGYQITREVLCSEGED